MRAPSRGPLCARSSPPRLPGGPRGPLGAASPLPERGGGLGRHGHCPQMGRRRSLPGRWRPGRSGEEGVFEMGLESPPQGGTCPFPSGSICHLLREAFSKHLSYLIKLYGSCIFTCVFAFRVQDQGVSLVLCWASLVQCFAHSRCFIILHERMVEWS